MKLKLGAMAKGKKGEIHMYQNFKEFISQIKSAGEQTVDINGETFLCEILIFNDYRFFDTQDQAYLGDDIANTKTLIAIFQKGFTVAPGIVLTTKVPKKGLFIFSRGDINNNGKISMTGKGANAPGQNVYLYHSTDQQKIDMINAIGSNGGSKVEFFGDSATARTSAGRPGINGVDRGTGGGGSGAIYCRRGAYNSSGAGAAGTSFSGGSGGGGFIAYMNNNSTQLSAGNGAINGGTGGTGAAYQLSGGKTSYVGIGGSGNPYGKNATTVSGSGSASGGNGGLLVIYVKKLTNTGSIEVNGESSGSGLVGASASGGGGGGGSLNIYTFTFSNTGETTATGGNSGSAHYLGGKGGDGTVNIDYVSDPIGFSNFFLLLKDDQLFTIKDDMLVPFELQETISVDYIKEHAILSLATFDRKQKDSVITLNPITT
ncbi:hypothetical protein [Lysinibacillus pakistanensis]|uniref:hypothetical protein n=1 Tax=Lysinibacillus pakistanensis TaxID=759811 RepID=UPI003D297709